MPQGAPLDFGSMLRQARERQGLSLGAIADATKIPNGVLEGLERNEISRLPGGIFTRAFIRAYAKEVKIDPEEAVRAFITSFPSEDPAVASGEPQDRPRSLDRYEVGEGAARAVRRALAVIVPIAIVAVYLAWSGRLDSWWRAAPPPAPPTHAPAGTPVAADVALPPEVPLDVAPPAGESAVPPPAGDQSLVPEGARTAPAEPSAAGARPDGVLRLTLAASGRCWVSLRSDGVRVYAGTMEAGERRDVDVGGRISLTVGDAGVFAFSINGMPARPMGTAGQQATAIITAQNYKTFLQPQ